MKVPGVSGHLNTGARLTETRPGSRRAARVTVP
jgi:hypothetical protein